jgi:hypothetical protein
MNKKLFALLLAFVSATAFAKLPPLNDEAKAKAEEAKAKTAHTGKVDAYLLCKSQDKWLPTCKRPTKPKPASLRPLHLVLTQVSLSTHHQRLRLLHPLRQHQRQPWQQHPPKQQRLLHR